MKRLLPFLLLSLSFLSPQADAQESADYNDYLAGMTGRYSLYLMLDEVAFELPDGFWCDAFGRTDNAFLQMPGEKEGRTSEFSLIKSANKDFLTLMEIRTPSCALSSWPKGEAGAMMDLMQYHKVTIAEYAERNSGQKNIRNFPHYYHPTAYARQAFNADTVITFPLKVWRKPYKRKYKHALGMTIQKNNRSFIQLVILYTNKGKEKLDSYLRSLEKMVWFRDPEDFLDFQYEEPGEQVIVGNRSEGKKKRGKR